MENEICRNLLENVSAKHRLEVRKKRDRAGGIDENFFPQHTTGKNGKEMQDDGMAEINRLSAPRPLAQGDKLRC